MIVSLRGAVTGLTFTATHHLMDVFGPCSEERPRPRFPSTTQRRRRPGRLREKKKKKKKKGRDGGPASQPLGRSVGRSTVLEDEEDDSVQGSKVIDLQFTIPIFLSLSSPPRIRARKKRERIHPLLAFIGKLLMPFCEETRRRTRGLTCLQIRVRFSARFFWINLEIGSKFDRKLKSMKRIVDRRSLATTETCAELVRKRRHYPLQGANEFTD